MLRYQVALSDISFKVMGANLRLFKAMHLPVISTARPFEFYRKVFFEDACQADVLSSLASKRVVDIGCGLTPFTEDSMFQVCRRSGVDFYGIDPKLADGFKFGLFDRLKSVATGATSMPRADMPGQEKAIAAFADNLPFADQSVDLILSCWLLFAWIQDETLLVRIFTEFDRVLVPRGHISLFPTMGWPSVERRYPSLAKLLASYQVSQRFLVGVNPSSMPPTFVTRLVKYLI